MADVDFYSDRQSIIDACHSTIASAPSSFLPDLANSKTTGAPEWHPFELPAWEVGERIRRSIKAQPRLKRDLGVLDAIVQVVATRNLRRGRQSFVMALGFTSAAKSAEAVAPYLADSDIQGHVADTLLKMRAPGFGAAIAALESHPVAWIRHVARTYRGKYGDAV